MSEIHSAIASYISRNIDEISMQDDIPNHDAWPYVSAEMLGYEADTLEFFSRNDSGIDYCARGNQTFEVFQCKMHEPNDAGDLELEKAFGPEGVNDLRRAADFLLKGVTPVNVDSRLLGFREQLKAELNLLSEPCSESGGQPNTTISVIFHLITLGDNLVPTAKTAIQAFNKELRDLENKTPGLRLVFEHNGISDIAEFFENPDITRRKPRKIRLSLAYDKLKFKTPQEAEIRAAKFVTFYTPADDIVSAARSEGVALFDSNVRYELTSSNINEEIRRSASHPKTMRVFHLYNNGVTIVAAGWAYKDKKTVIEIREPCIINGCQTVRSLAKVKKELEVSAEENPHLIKSFDETCLVMVRLINKEHVNSEEIVRAANTQNAMEPRNLLSNRTEQLMLEREFQELGWFYARKDGAIDALKESKQTSLRTPIGRFQVKRAKRGPKALRTCDNRDIARCWLSFIGYSDEGKNKRKRHFSSDGTTGLYKKIFQQTPKLHRGLILLGNVDAEKNMKDGRPPAIWLLYCYHLFQVTKRLLPVATRIRARVRKELKEAKKDVTLPAVNERILCDDELRLSFALSMLDHVVLELAGFAFARALGDKWLSPAPGKKAILKGVIREYHITSELPNGLNEEGILNLKEECIKTDPALIAIRLAVQGIEATLNRPEFTASFKSSERKSRYLQSDQMLREYVKNVEEYHKYLVSPDNFVSWWKRGSPYKAIRQLLT